MTIEANEWNVRLSLQERRSLVAGCPTVVLAVPGFDSKEGIGPPRREAFPRRSSRRVGEDRDTIGGGNGVEQRFRSQSFAEERRPPHEHMHTVVGVAVL